MPKAGYYLLSTKHMKAARTGGHFVSEKAAKWAPIAGGLSVN
jgi:hypothetical protein